MSFSSGQGNVQFKPNLVWSIYKVGRLLDKKIFGMAFLGKNFVFRTEICDYFKYVILKNRSFLSGQEVVQIKLNLRWSIPCVDRA